MTDARTNPQWYLVKKDGATIGERGSESGIILQDEEYSDGARITIEQDGVTAPYAITCGIYGWMVHTCFFANLDEAEVAFMQIKDELSRIISLIPLKSDPEVETKINKVYPEIKAFVERY